MKDYMEYNGNKYTYGDIVWVNMAGTYYYDKLINGDYWVLGVVSQLAQDNSDDDVDDMINIDSDIWVEFAKPNEHTPYESVFDISCLKPIKEQK